MRISIVQTTARLFLMTFMGLGLVTGCASTGDSEEDTSAEEAAAVQEAAPAQEESTGMTDAERDALAQAESDMSHSKHADSSAGVTSYSVVDGDNLWDISGKENVYADSYQWPLIYKTNRDKIKDADLIYPGQVFDIDQNASASDIDAAINHAKTRGAWSVGDVEQSDLDYLAR